MIDLMITLEKILDNNNISRAIKRVVSNKGICGVDKMTVDELPVFWNKYGEKICENIYNDMYTPQPLMRMYIKQKGKQKKRMLSIPTVLDRMIQQAILQVLSKKYQKKFSPNSFGYRKGKRTMDALNMCLNYMNDGYIHIVDIDIEGFFDNVNHDVLLDILKNTDIDDKVIKLINKFLKNKVLCGGRIETVKKGISQGSPLSPLLANILLNELDLFISECDLKHIRYADDVLILSDSDEHASKIMYDITNFLQNKLMLNLNKEKSQIVMAHKLDYMGYAFKKDLNGKYILCINDKILEKALSRIEYHVKKDDNNIKDWWNRLGSFNRGWFNYYKYADETELLPALEKIENYCNELVDDKLHDICNKSNISMNDLILTIFDSSQFVNIVEWRKYVKGKEE